LGTPQAPQDEAKTGTAVPQLGHSLLSIADSVAPALIQRKRPPNSITLLVAAVFPQGVTRAWNHTATEVQHLKVQD
jgi:hypothetical protein